MMSYRLKVTQCLEDVDLSAERDVMSMKLSGGQKRKLSLAMAIIGDPRVGSDVKSNKSVICDGEIYCKTAVGVPEKLISYKLGFRRLPLLRNDLNKLEEIYQQQLIKVLRRVAVM